MVKFVVLTIQKKDERGCTNRKAKEGEECYCSSQCLDNLNCNPVAPNFNKYSRACCPAGKVWNGTHCTESDLLSFCPKDTNCKSFWPNKQGKLLSINEENYACDLFEVCHPYVQSIAREAFECCSKECNSNCHSYCKEALEYSGYNKEKTYERLKFCMGLYITSGFGPAKRFMIGYNDAEICCGAKYFPDNNIRDVLEGVCKSAYGDSFIGKCEPKIENTGLKDLECKEAVSKYPLGWKSDNNMKENSCIFSDLPAHVTLNFIKTGICVDYSVALTSALRAAGYSSNEVYTVVAPGHAYNLVLFPLNEKYTIVDTTANYPNNWRPGQQPGKYNFGNIMKSRCEYEQCMNDNGILTCPPKNLVYGC